MSLRKLNFPNIEPSNKPRQERKKGVIIMSIAIPVSGKEQSALVPSNVNKEKLRWKKSEEMRFIAKSKSIWKERVKIFLAKEFKEIKISDKALNLYVEDFYEIERNLILDWLRGSEKVSATRIFKALKTELILFTTLKEIRKIIAILIKISPKGSRHLNLQALLKQKIPQAVAELKKDDKTPFMRATSLKLGKNPGYLSILVCKGKLLRKQLASRGVKIKRCQRKNNGSFKTRTKNSTHPCST